MTFIVNIIYIILNGDFRNPPPFLSIRLLVFKSLHYCKKMSFVPLKLSLIVLRTKNVMFCIVIVFFMHNAKSFKSAKIRKRNSYD